MPGSHQVLNTEQMRSRYGAFYAASPGVLVQPSRVPKALHPLIPYAEFWGIADDWEREHLVMEAPYDIQKNLKEAVELFDDELNDWLAGNEADCPTPSDEYVAFAAMRMAADSV